jgi:ABC-type multidrug transport system fused ATPase/permease subunit
VLRQAKVIVLDEATSNIDVRTEQKILQLMNSELQSSTVITIAHRLNTIIKSDRVAVLGDGKLLEYASPKELVTRPDSHFSHLLQELKNEE